MKNNISKTKKKSKKLSENNKTNEQIPTKRSNTINENKSTLTNNSKTNNFQHQNSKLLNKKSVTKTKIGMEKTEKEKNDKIIKRNESLKKQKKINHKNEINELKNEETDLYLKKQIDELKNYYKNQNYDNVLKLSDIILFKNPDLNMISYIKANSLLFTDKYEEAIKVN